MRPRLAFAVVAGATAVFACGAPSPAGTAARAPSVPAARAEASSAPTVSAPSDAGAPVADPCPDVPSTGTAALSIREIGGRLWLGFEGATESTTGRAYALELRVVGRTLSVTIATTSKPTDPRGVSLDAEGTNGGNVVLPEGLSGVYELAVRQGASRVTYGLEVTPEAVTVTPRAVPPTSPLRFGEPHAFRHCR